MSRFRYILILYLLTSVFCQNLNCNSKDCDGCVKEIDCYWCTKVNESSNQVKQCLSKNEIKFCSIGYLYEIETEVIKDDSNKDKVKISTGLNKGAHYKFTFEPLKHLNYPLDIYFLIDFSYSMKNISDDLPNAIKNIAEAISSNVTNVNFGFGTFIDKETMPFINFHPKKLEHPCTDKQNCTKAYSFKNHLPLQGNITKMQNELERLTFSGNVDRPEGGLDALLQVALCEDEINWIDNSTKIVALLTDNDYHIAGDGKLAGIGMPYDLQCHMENHQYVADTIYDYPSVGQIIEKIDEKKINVLFLIKGTDAFKRYEAFSQVIPNSKVVHLSNNIITQSIVGYYKNATESITFKSNADEKDVDVKFQIKNCNNQDSCNKTIHEVLDVEVVITPKTCLNKTNIDISFATLQKLKEIELDVVCDCKKCSKKFPDEKASEQCSSHGTLSCGKCKCDLNYYGDKCVCQSDSENTMNEMNCMNDDKICSNNGQCNCGKCKCIDDYYGEYCQCNDKECPIHNDQLCSGKGSCKCNKCECNDGFSGSMCECDASNCQNPSTNLSCSENGVCNCGKCDCTDVNYTGIYCEICPVCLQKNCQKMQSCVEERIKNKDKSECEGYPIKENCEVQYEETVDNCKFVFDNCVTKTMLYQAKEIYYCQICPLSATVLSTSIILPLLLAVIIGLVVWKFVVTHRDRIEYIRFEKNLEQSKWNEELNPLFKSTKTTYLNPLYDK